MRRVVVFLLLSFFCNFLAHAKTIDTKLPIFKLNTKDEEKIKRNGTKVEGTLSVLANGSQSKDWEFYPIRVHVRGSSSSFYPKKQYTLQILNSENKKEKVSLLGMAKDSSWILSGPYADKTLIRNPLAYNMARKMGLVAPRTRYIELFLNEKYHGIYILIEKNNRHKEKTDVSEIENGGFILRVEHKKEPYFKSKIGTNFTLVYPDVDELNELPKEQLEWMKNWIDQFELSLASNEYQKYIDENSFIDYFLIQELWKNIDSFRRSMYLHKGKDNKIHMGPMWDFDIAGGNMIFYKSMKTEGWLHARLKFYDFAGSYVPWFNQLLTHPLYKQKLINRWFELRKEGNVLNDTQIYKMIQNEIESIGPDAIKRNFDRWKIIGRPLFPVFFFGVLPPLKSYDAEVIHLQKFLMLRAQWIDRNIHGLGKFHSGKLTY